MLRKVKLLFFLFRYFLTFAFLKDLKAGQEECVNDRKVAHCYSMRGSFYQNMLKQEVDYYDE